MKRINQKGTFIEKQLNDTHRYYRSKKIMIVYKVPVLQMLNHNSALKRAHYFCDYVGCFQGWYFEFEAKETSRTSFHWSQLRKSQRYKLERVYQNQGLSFVIIYFGYYKEFWLLFYDDLLTFMEQNSQIISYENCQKIGHKLNLKNSKIIDYQPILAKKIASQEALF